MSTSWSQVDEDTVSTANQDSTGRNVYFEQVIPHRRLPDYTEPYEAFTICGYPRGRFSVNEGHAVARLKLFGFHEINRLEIKNTRRGRSLGENGLDLHRLRFSVSQGPAAGLRRIVESPSYAEDMHQINTRLFGSDVTKYMYLVAGNWTEKNIVFELFHLTMLQIHKFADPIPVVKLDLGQIEITENGKEPVRLAAPELWNSSWGQYARRAFELIPRSSSRQIVQLLDQPEESTC